MFRQRNSGYRRSRSARAWLAWTAVLAGCATVVLAVHFAAAPTKLDATSAANVFRDRAAGAAADRAAHHGYGRGGYTMMPHTTEAAAATTMNWSGYAATGNAGAFTSVSSSWVQPGVTCGGTDTFSSFWAGLDGIGTQDLEQTGTEADCANGTAAYGGWFEFFPAAPVFYKEPVQPADKMSASVVSGGGGSFALTLTDATQGWTKTTTQTVPGARLSSAEVIAEAPSSQAVLPLADFGTVDFTGADVNGQAIGGDQPVALILVSGGGGAGAAPSALSGGNSFSVTWSGGSGTTGTGTSGTGGTGTGGTGGTGGGGTGGAQGGHRHHHQHQD
jgi:Peptidase A4 family